MSSFSDIIGGLFGNLNIIALLVRSATLLLIPLLTLLLVYGLYGVLTDYLTVPSKKARKAVLALKNTKTTFAESLTIPIAKRIVRFIQLEEGRRVMLQRKLYSAEIHYTPEFYVAKAIAESIVVALFAIPAYFIMPLISVVCIVMGISVYFKRLQELDEIIREKSEKINGELVLFASTIKQQLAASRDVMRILESFRKICGREFLHELDMTIADMKTGNYETALRNLESRIPNVGLSEIIHGLFAVMRGDDQRGYFEMLAHDLAVEDKERLKRIAMKRPDKLRPATIMLICSFLAMYIYVIGVQVVEQMSMLF